METIKVRVDGMTCGGCVKSVQKALNAHDGVTEAVADLDKKSVDVNFDPAKIQEAGIKAAIEDAGFDVAG